VPGLHCRWPRLCGEVSEELKPICQRFACQVCGHGFEPVDLLEELLCCVRQLERGESRVEQTPIPRQPPQGNAAARALIARVFRAV